MHITNVLLFPVPRVLILSEPEALKNDRFFTQASPRRDTEAWNWGLHSYIISAKLLL